MSKPEIESECLVPGLMTFCDNLWMISTLNIEVGNSKRDKCLPVNSTNEMCNLG